MDGKNIIETEGTGFAPLFPANQINSLNVDDTLRVLGAIRPIVAKLDQFDNKEDELTSDILNASKGIEEIIKIPPKGYYIFLVSLLSIIFIIQLLGGDSVGSSFTLAFIMTGIFVVGFRVGGSEGIKLINELFHTKDEEIKKYSEVNIEPLQKKLAEIQSAREMYMQTGEYKWACDVVGENMLFSDCINALESIIRSHRADTLKEALNKMDDEMHKARMERMQQDIKNSAETVAMEAEKQTELAQQTADSSRATARYARQIARSLR